jgi:hypothetical protein
MQTTFLLTTHRHHPLSTRLGRITLILALLLAVGAPMAHLHANPYGSPGSYGSYGCGGGRGYYQPPQCHGWTGNCNRGGWLGTGVPNGLGWTLFGLAAASAISRPTYVAPAPVVVEQPVYVQQPVLVSQPQVTQAPLVNYNGIPCYFINGNYYPATAMQ